MHAVGWFFTPPVHTLTIADPKNIVAIAIFVGVAVSVASVVDLAARRTQQAARLRAESEILSVLAGSVLRGETSLEALLERVRETFGMESVALLERASDVDPWTCAGSVGTRTAVARPEDADVDMPVSDRMALALSGRVLPAEDGTGWPYYATNLIVTLALAFAANASFGGLPVLMSVLAKEHRLPHLFGLRKERPFYRWGVVALALPAALLLIAVNADTHRMIPRWSPSTAATRSSRTSAASC